MVKGFEGNAALIESWLRNKDTVEFLGVWERINNPSFNPLEFEGIRNEAGLNRFILSIKRWISSLLMLSDLAWNAEQSGLQRRQLNLKNP